MSTITWSRPSGTTVTTNDRKETIEKCQELGWEKTEPELESMDSDEEGEEGED